LLVSPNEKIYCTSGSLRRGEITGLHWEDVNLATRKIVVRRNRVTANGRVIEQKTTKTKAGLRTVPLSDFAVATLLAWQLRQAEERLSQRRRRGRRKGMCSPWTTAGRSIRAM
jgi:integrase